MNSNYYLQQLIRCFSIAIITLCCYNYWRLDTLHQTIVVMNNKIHNDQPPRILLLNDFKQQQQQMIIPTIIQSTTTTEQQVQNDSNNYDPSSLLYEAAKYNSVQYSRRTRHEITTTSEISEMKPTSNTIITTSSHQPARPPLSSLIQGWNVTGDVSWLLNYAIVGFPKCGTSTLMYHFADQSTMANNNNQEIYFYPHERCELAYNQQVRLIEDLYQQIPTSVTMRGIKCPFDLENPTVSMINYKKYFPTTDFIVGIRHPILWFESFYNFRVHNNYTMPSAERLIGKCKKGSNMVCTDRSKFHVFLSTFGKTNIQTDPNEYQYMTTKDYNKLKIVPTNRRIFLYELTQLKSSDTGTGVDEQQRSIQFRTDLQNYLQLQQPIERILRYKPGRNHTDTKTLQAVDSKKIDICDNQFTELRNVLLENAINASKWITNYFIESPDVVVSNKEYFRSSIMKVWEIDPCIQRLNNRTTSEV